MQFLGDSFLLSEPKDYRFRKPTLDGVPGYAHPRSLKLPLVVTAH